MSQHTGGCRCGAIRFEVAGAPVHISYCHCGDCRRASGAPLSAFVGFRAADLTFHGAKGAAYGEAPVERRFCATCGSPISYADARLDGQIFLMLGAMDRPEDYVPTVHGYTREKLPYLHIDDGLPRRETTTVPRPEGENR
ncbi:GFA family protein [Rhizobium sp. TRM95111]|uniref:GFA family protein n=1 Tax=Rhizobium alarense TaxID=2846851 RepID=UPI001F47D1E9|nr:GFA family protein [Rhizobium alarense]MCF3640777.1 GFA family protein [Rhizobium alarense]